MLAKQCHARQVHAFQRMLILHAIETTPMPACMYVRTHLLHAPALVLSSHARMLDASCSVLSVPPSLAHPSIRLCLHLPPNAFVCVATHACTHLNVGRSITQWRATPHLKQSAGHTQHSPCARPLACAPRPPAKPSAASRQDTCSSASQQLLRTSCLSVAAGFLRRAHRHHPSHIHTYVNSFAHGMRACMRMRARYHDHACAQGAPPA